MLPRVPFFARSEQVKFDQAARPISAELVTPYPPGIPAVAPGELYTEENIAYLQEFVEIGGFVEGRRPEPPAAPGRRGVTVVLAI
jgi:arginine/lysine/ornithine decarboxylase